MFKSASPFFVIIFIQTLLAGCTQVSYHEACAASKQQHEFRCTPDTLPFDEYWSGITFNGQKIGYAHQKIGGAANMDSTFSIENQAVMTFMFLGNRKEFQLKTRDLVDRNLQLIEFEYTYVMDGSTMHLTGKRSGQKLYFKNGVSDETSQEVLLLTEEKLYPAGVTNLIPLFIGVGPGKEYNYTVFDGETQTLERVVQKIENWQKDETFTVLTKIRGNQISTWFNRLGLPEREEAMSGAMVAHLVSENVAKSYLAESATSKSDSLLDFSLIKTARKISNATETRRMKVRINGISPSFALPGSTTHQNCRRTDDFVDCIIEAEVSNVLSTTLTAEERMRALKSSTVIPAENSTITDLAVNLTRYADTPLVKVKKILRWLMVNIKKTNKDSFSALDVLRNRSAECQGHSYLFTALARNRGIPVRVVNGIVYSERYSGFLFHTWAECFIDGDWLPVDPTYNQAPADATHIKLIAGETLAEFEPLVALIGKLKVEVLEIE